MPYAKINPTGCGIHKNRAKLRLDFFLEPDDPSYDKFLNRSFHSHFIYPNSNISDDALKAEIGKCLNYFYAFHQHCWQSNKRFIDEWKKVPSKAGGIRCPFVKGDVKDLSIYEAKVRDILLGLQSLDMTFVEDKPQDLSIGKEGTITVGEDAIDRDGSKVSGYTTISHVEAHGTGTLDTAEIYPHETMGGVKIGTFYQSATGKDYKRCRDMETIGTVTAGSPDPDVLTGLDLSIQVKDCAGIYFSSGSIERDTSGGSGYWTVEADGVTVESNLEYIYGAGYVLSFQATGSEVSGTLLERSTDDDMGVCWTGSEWTEVISEDICIGYQAADLAKHGFGGHFPNITIPKGATIKSAFMILTPNASRISDDVKGRITGNLIPNAGVWSTVQNYRDRRGTVMGGSSDNYITDAQVDWDYIEDTRMGISIYTPEFKDILQEIINQEDWESGNGIAIWVDDHDDRSDHELLRYRIFAAIEDVTYDELKVKITWESEGAVVGPFPTHFVIR